MLLSQKEIEQKGFPFWKAFCAIDSDFIVCYIKIKKIFEGDFLKRILTIFLFAVLLLTFAGCSKRPEWRVDDDLGNGVLVLIPETYSEDKGNWYCTVDTSTEEILSVNLKYFESYGAIKGTECKIDGKKVTPTIESGERDEGGVMFYSFSADNLKLSSDKVIEITQNFENKVITIKFSPKDISQGIQGQ